MGSVSRLFYFLFEKPQKIRAAFNERGWAACQSGSQQGGINMASMTHQVKQLRYDLKKQYAKEQTDRDGMLLPTKNITTGTRKQYLNAAVIFCKWGLLKKITFIAINRANRKECDNSAEIVSKSLVL